MHKVVADKSSGKKVNLDTEQIKEIEKTWKNNDVESKKQAKIQARRDAYGPMEDQLDMMYWDMVNGTEKWKDHIAHVKATSKLDI